jgi:ComF family protein
MISIRTIWDELLQFFYPQHCLCCGRSLIAGEQQICLHCFCDLPRAGYHRRSGNPMMKLFAGIPQIREMASFLLFEKGGHVQRLIHSFKYHENKQLAEQLGRTASLEMKADGLFRDIDFLLPIPLHPVKERKRGYNQSEHIAHGFASVYHRPVCRNVLYRTIHTASQTYKSIYERHLNMERKFAVRETDTLAGQHVLLIDDVITTGSTTIACIEALSVIPDIRISIFSLSIVPVLAGTDEPDF